MEESRLNEFLTGAQNFEAILYLYKRLGAVVKYLFALTLFLISTLLGAADNDIRLNSVGYRSDLNKIATVINSGTQTFYLRRVSDNSAAFTGTLSAQKYNNDTGQNVRFADFSSVTEEGDFYLEVANVGRSVDFRIADDVYNDSMYLNIQGFYGHRCGMAVSYTHKGETFSHAACHTSDGDLNYVGGGGIKNGTQGWHDAGDYGKYVVNAGITLGMMFQAWEHFGSKLETYTWSEFPAVERNNTIPDFLDELKFETDWLLKMQAANGSVYHKLTRTNFSSFVMPSADTEQRYYVPWGSPATADFVAMMAMAARVFQPYDAPYAQTCLTAAQSSYTFLRNNLQQHDPDQGAFSTGEYGTSDTDDRLWAAAEMWVTTGDGTAHTDFVNRANNYGNKIAEDWDWGDVHNIGMFSYAQSSRGGKNVTVLTDIESDIIDTANNIVTKTNNHGYGRGLDNYYWGANGAVVRQAMNLYAAWLINGNDNYIEAAASQLAHVYGRNYYNRSWVTGEGKDPPLFPHDRPSGSDGIANPWPGHLVGGGHPGATDWNDDQDDYATNEIAINWSGAMTYILAMLCTSNGPVGTPTDSPTISPTATITPTPTAVPCGIQSVYRVNCGGRIIQIQAGICGKATELRIVRLFVLR